MIILILLLLAITASASTVLDRFESLQFYTSRCVILPDYINEEDGIMPIVAAASAWNSMGVDEPTLSVEVSSNNFYFTLPGGDSIKWPQLIERPPMTLKVAGGRNFYLLVGEFESMKAEEAALVTAIRESRTQIHDKVRNCYSLSLPDNFQMANFKDRIKLTSLGHDQVREIVLVDLDGHLKVLEFKLLKWWQKNSYHFLLDEADQVLKIRSIEFERVDTDNVRNRLEARSFVYRPREYQSYWMMHQQSEILERFAVHGITIIFMIIFLKIMSQFVS